MALLCSFSGEVGMLQCSVVCPCDFLLHKMWSAAIFSLFDGVYREWQDALCLVGAGGLGVSLVLIHIYVAPLKRFLQLLWAAGVMGGISIMASQVCTILPVT